jgi:hypothetical protein
MEDGGELELGQLVDFEAQRARRQVELGRDLHQRIERRALDRAGIDAAQARKIDAVAVMRRDHGQAGEAAFGGFGLQHGRSWRLQGQSKALIRRAPRRTD